MGIYCRSHDLHKVVDTVEGMSWKGFMRGLRAVMSEPDYLRTMTPEQRAERRRQSARQQMFAVQMFDPPKPHPCKAAAPRSHDEDSKPSSGD
jgi:hypothetical protein